MRPERRWLGACAVLAGLSACETHQAARPTGATTASALVATSFEMTRVAQSLRGRSRDEVVAALGPATLVRFDSGYEVWVYRFAAPTPREPADARDHPPARSDPAEREPLSELVLLVAPSGSVAKVRVRSPVARNAR